MNGEKFIDTNILIYQLDQTDERKSAIAEEIVRSGLQRGDACISFQVIQECLNTVLRKAEIPLDIQSAQKYLQTVLMRLFRIPATIPLYREALNIQERYQYGFYDSLIIAAALESGCEYLLSEDLQHGQKIGPLIIHNPFV